MPKRKTGTVRKAISSRKPFGYGLYTTVHRWRHGAGATRLSPKGYKHSPTRAWEIALGVRPGAKSTVTRLRKRKTQLTGVR